MICLKHNKEIIGVIGPESLCEDCEIEKKESKEFTALFLKTWVILGSLVFFVWIFCLGYYKINVTDGMAILDWSEIIKVSVLAGIFYPVFVFLLVLVVIYLMSFFQKSK